MAPQPEHETKTSSTVDAVHGHEPARRTYRNHLLDSTRWERFVPREDDVVVVTPYKSGTTWMLNLVHRLIFLGIDAPPFHEQWIDCRFRQTAHEMETEIEATTHRRYLKSHLALDGIPFHPQVSYIVVGRDPRDVFMSLWNHHHALVPQLDAFAAVPGRVGPPLPPPAHDVRDAWRDWMTRGWFEWEQEGYPFWGNLHHVESWWSVRERPNVLFVHFGELTSDLAAQIRRVAEFLGIPVSDEAIGRTVDDLRVERLEEQMARRDPAFARAFFRHRGRNGRWRDVLSPEDLELYERTAAELLPVDCRTWLEGRSSVD